MEDKHKQLLDGLEKILKGLNHINSNINQLDEKYLRLNEWKIYHEHMTRDLNNLGDKVRSMEKVVKEELSNYSGRVDDRLSKLESKNHDQDIATTKISGKVASIIGGASLFVGAIITIILKLFGL